jgi:Ca2+-binding RTX toxin-like protein
MANSISINDAQIGSYSSGTTTIGWNSAQASVWGNTAADTFTFAGYYQDYANMYTQAINNDSWNFYSGGGADTISFTAYDVNLDPAAMISFNMSQLQSTSGSSNTWTVIGSANSDQFEWSGSTNPSIALIDGGTGSDTLTLATAASGKQINLYDATFKNIEVVVGSAYADTLRGTTESETLIGAAGADILWGGEGDKADSLKGGAGADTFWFSYNQNNDTIAVEGTTTDSASDVVKLDGLDFADLTFAGSGSDAVIGFKSATGYAGTLTIEGWLASAYATPTAPNADRLNRFIAADKTFGLALSNNDGASLYGTTLSDYMQGGRGKDTLVAGAGDSLFGGANDDFFQYLSTADKFDGGANDAVGDKLSAAHLTTGVEINLYDSKISNIEILEGTSLADVLRGTTAIETLIGGAGADQLWGGDGSYADNLEGGSGADTFWFGANQGADTIATETTPAYLASDVVRLNGINFADLSFSVSSSGAGNDAVLSFKDSTSYTGSLTIDEWVAQTYVTSANTKRLNQFVTDDKTFGLALANNESATLTGTAFSDYMLGRIGKDTLTAGAGDSLFGGANDDFFKYLSTADKFDGGADTDTLSGAHLTAGVEINLYDSKISNMEVLEGSAYDDILRGTTNAETLTSGAGADHLWGAEGADSLIGGTGADTYWIGLGDGSDTIMVDNASNGTDSAIFKELSFDRLSFERINGSADLQISIDNDATNSLVLQTWGSDYGTASNTKRTQIVNKFVAADLTFGLAIGTDAADTLTGTALADYMKAGAGDDSISASAGADTIFGGDGADTIAYRSTQTKVDGQEGTDVLTASSAAAGVDIDLRNVDATRTTFTNIERVIGSGYDDILRGSTNAETLEGGAGADAIWGAGANDWLITGAGTDTVWFGGADGNDTIEASTVNLNDMVVFTSINGQGIGGADFSSVVLSGTDLILTLTTGDSLTVQSWDATAGNKLNKFNFGDNGNYSVSFTDGVASWAKIV